MAGATSGGLAGQVALVTGASRGIGAAIARRLAADGAAVAVNYRTGRAQADAVVAAIEAAGGRAVALGADVADPAELARLFDATERHLGRVDVLVNNAGILRPTPIGGTEPATLDALFAVNVRAPWLATQEFVRRRGDARGGRVIHIGSGAGHRAFPGHAGYSASKAALEGMTRSMAAELGSRGITVNTVAPGTTETDMLPPSLAKVVVPMTALGRLGRPEDIAGVIAFLASEAGGWITGTVLDANGGLAL